VNNGGYDQFFTNSSREFASTIVDSLQHIGCKKTADITQKAIKALVTSGWSATLPQPPTQLKDSAQCQYDH